jgi:pimeloyl-ACP methyl ester carboxylesterase
MKTQVQGVTIAYDDQGAGLPIVFLHAFPLNRSMWSEQVAALSRGFRAIAIDLRGHGESDAPFWRYSLEQYALDVKEVLAGLGIRKAIFVGLSMGGYLEFTLYRLYPDLMLGVVLADTRAEADKPEQIQWRYDLAQQTAAMGPAAVIAEMLPKLLAPKTYERNPDLVARVKSMQAAAPVPGIIGDLMAIAERPDSTDLLPSMAVPALVIVGQEDVLTTPADAERIANGIHGARLIVIPNAGHLSNLEQPERFTSAIEAFATGLQKTNASPTAFLLISFKNSFRVCSCVRNAPSMELVTARVFCFSTPLIIMHKWRASMTTATPWASNFRLSVSAICVVSRSCTCSRRAKASTTRGILLRPTTFLFGRYPT